MSPSSIGSPSEGKENESEVGRRPDEPTAQLSLDGDLICFCVTLCLSAFLLATSAGLSASPSHAHVAMFLL